MNHLLFQDILETNLSEFEISRLSQQFGVDYYQLDGTRKPDRIRMFLASVTQANRLTGLAEATVALRPDLTDAVAQLFQDDDEDLAWLDQMGQSETASDESNSSWDWAGDLRVNEELASADSIRELPSVGPIELAAATVDEARTLPYQRIPQMYRKRIGRAPIPNPFTPGQRIAGANMFFGREREQAIFQAQLKAGGSLAVVSPRLFGGSSFLYAMAAQSKIDRGLKLLPALANMKEPVNHTIDGLLNNIWAQWWRGVNPELPVPHAGTLAEFVMAGRSLRAAGFRPLLFLDELEQLVWRNDIFDDGFLDAWYELGKDEILQMAVTSHEALATLLTQVGSNSRFFELFNQIDIGLLDWDAAHTLLRVPVERAGLTLPNGAVDELLIETGPHPFYLQLGGYYLFDAVSRDEYSPERVFRQFTAAATPHWYDLWVTLSPPAQAHYPAEMHPLSAASGEGDPQSLIGDRQVRFLFKKGLLVADDQGFRPFSRGFAAYINRIRQASELVAKTPVDSVPA